MLTSQPQTGPLRVDPYEPLARGLIQAYTGLGLVDAVAPSVVPAIYNGGVVTQRPDGLEFATTSAGLARLALPHEKTAEFTIMVNLKMLGNSSAYACIIGLMYDLAGNSPYGCQIDMDGGGNTPRLAFNMNGSAQSTPPSPTPVSTTKFEWLIARLRSGYQELRLENTILGTSSQTGAPTYTNTSMIGLGNILGDGRIANCIIRTGLQWGRYISDDEVAAVMVNQWRLFEDPFDTPIWLATLTAGGQSYAYTSAGGITFGGMAMGARGVAKLSTGGWALSGAAPRAIGSARAPAGGLTFSGTATKVRGRVAAAVGGLSLSGAAGVWRSAARVTAGSLKLVGAAIVSTTSAVQSRIVIPVGGLLFAGASAIGRTATRAVSGGIKFAGHAISAAGSAGSFLASLLPIFGRRRR